MALLISRMSIKVIVRGLVALIGRAEDSKSLGCRFEPYPARHFLAFFCAYTSSDTRLVYGIYTSRISSSSKHKIRPKNILLDLCSLVLFGRCWFIIWRRVIYKKFRLFFCKGRLHCIGGSLQFHKCTSAHCCLTIQVLGCWCYCLQTTRYE